MPITLQVITPERSFATATADHVTWIAVDGQLGVRPGHAPLVGLLGIGYVHAKRAGHPDVILAVRGGVGQVFKDDLTILAEQAVPGESVDRAAVQARLAKLQAESPADTFSAKRRDDDVAWCNAQLTLPQYHMGAQELSDAARAAVKRSDG